MLSSIALCVIGAAIVGAVLLFPAPKYQAQSSALSAVPGVPGAQLVSGSQSWGPAPSFMLPALDGKQVGPRDWHGRPLLLVFWGSWCVPCHQEAPVLVRLAAHYAPVGLGVLAVDEGDSLTVARQFARHYGVRFPVTLDEKKQVLNWYGVVGLPTIALIGRDGRLLSIHPGPLGASDVAAFLAPALRS